MKFRKIIFFLFLRFADVPVLQEGKLEINQQTLSNNTQLKLDGTWDFFPYEFIDPHDIYNNDNKHKHVNLPDNLSKHLQQKDAIGYGTYHLNISLPENHNDILSLYFPSVHSAMDIYINGKLIDSLGTIAKTREFEIANTKPLQVDFKPESNNLDIVIHISNHELPKYGGILKSIRIGTLDSINNFQNKFNTLEVFIIITYAIHFIYGLFLILMGQRNKSLFYYISFILFVLISIMTDGAQTIQLLFNFNLDSLLKLKILGYMGISLFSLLFFKALYHNAFKNRLSTIIIYTHVLIGIITIFLPIEILYNTLGITNLINIFTFMYITYINIKHRFYHERYYQFIIFINLAMISGTISNFLFNYSDIKLAYYPFEIIFIIVGFTFLLFKRSIIYTEENQRLTNKLKTTNKLRELFTLSTSNEIRNPLQMILNVTHQKLAEKNITVSSQKQLSTIITMGKQINLALDDLQDIQNIYEGQFQLYKSRFSFVQLSKGLHELLTYLIDKDKVNLSINIPNDFPTLYADKERITQVLFNLLFNSIKYTHEGDISLHARTEKNFAIISIVDTGINIDEETINRLLDSKLAYDYQTKRTNFGIGLIVAKHIIEKHGGTIEISSNKENGTIFIFTIPLINQNEHTKKHHHSHDNYDFISVSDQYMYQNIINHPNYFKDVVKGANILIIDDDQLHLNYLYDVLSEVYTVTTVSDSTEALQLISENEFDLVISEVVMPTISGYELTKKIRKRYNIFDLPVILITSRNFEHDKFYGYSAGANDIVVKPVDMLELYGKIHIATTLKYTIRERLNYEAAWQQAQIKPHFLFNTLGTIISLSYIDHEKMISLLNEFSNYLRKSLKTSNTDQIISLKDELELVKSYLNIQKARFDYRLNIHLELDNLDDLYIPPLAVQTIVENALKHGVLSKMEGGNLTIRLKRYSDYAQLFVIDDGDGFDQNILDDLLNKDFNESEGIGLMNTNIRLKRLFGIPLEVKSSEEGTTVIFTIPYNVNIKNEE